LESKIADILHQTNQVITNNPRHRDTLGAVILSEIGDIHRFDAPGKLVAFAGLDVKVNQSGEFSEQRIEYPNVARHICGGLFGLPPHGRLFVILSFPTTTNLYGPEVNTISPPLVL
jgi:hypothetical protein